MRLRVTVADYNVGNLHSVKKAFEKNGAAVDVTADMKDLANADCIVFPGVGAFDMTMEKLLPHREEIRERLLSGVPALGICIGVQILFGSSEEGVSEGVGLFKGKITKLGARRVPHMGWNSVMTDDPLLDGIADRTFYFAHSYVCAADDMDRIIGTTEYEGNEFPSLFRTANTYGTQFHPEKSSESGLALIKNFIHFAEDRV
ncbi:MAG: imidazole glycerol phosphate synthase subunit HisH [Candidatus Methanoplasma sp.]|jgi:glutamine amidotransferase|nr:imidazole glycerol phosphate synthase subunit HisH [Candidatus Methanoplasma sp.]